MRRTAGSHIRNERGAILMMVAIFLVALLGMAALAVDLGILYAARGQVQRTADAAALAGGGVYLNTLDEEAARDAAIDYGARNLIRGEPVVIRPEDVDVIADSQKVRVRVYRTAERESAIPTFFGRILGMLSADVSAVAAAQAFPAGAIDGGCLLPFALPDRWREADGSWPTIYDDFDPDAGDTYVSWDEANEPNSNKVATGYSFPADVGYRIQIRGTQSQGSDYHPGWWRHVYFWDTSVPGNNQVIAAIAGCVSTELTPVNLDDDYITQPGNLSGPQIRNAFQSVIDQDPTATWETGANGGCNCLKRNGVEIFESPRIRPIALFSPKAPPQQGAFPVTITGFVNVFIESPIETEQGQQPLIWVRYMGINGMDAQDFEPGSGPVARVLRLVE